MSLPHALYFCQGAVFLLIILLALFGNLLVIVSVLRTKNLRLVICENCHKLDSANFKILWCKNHGKLKK